MYKSKGEVTSRGKALRENVFSYKPTIDAERARIFTQVYKQTEGRSPAIRQALSLTRFLSEMEIYTNDYELLVGNIGRQPRSGPIFPEYSTFWIDEIDTISEREHDPFTINDKDKKSLKDAFKYWEKRTLKDRIYESVPEDIKKAEEAGIISGEMITNGAPGHMVPDWETILHEGLGRLVEKAEARLQILELWKPGEIAKLDILRGMSIAGRAAIKFSERYANLAKEKAQDESISSRRKAELNKIANVCENVPKNPATTFWDALQSILFVFFATAMEANGYSITIGRLDQYLYPFYKRDIEEGKLSKEEARELLECFWIKLAEVCKVINVDTARDFEGFQNFINITIGGQSPEHNDQTNDLSYLLLDVTKNLKLTNPSTSVRIHKGTPHDFLIKACECNLCYKGGQPAFLNDEIVIQAQSKFQPHFSKEELYDWVVLGCVEPAFMGAGFAPNAFAIFYSVLKILELALNGGKDPETGYQLCPDEKKLDSCASFDEVMEALEKQIKYYDKLVAILNNCIQEGYRRFLPFPFASLVTRDCIEEGRSLLNCGRMIGRGATIITGPSSVGDSLASIKKNIFEEKKLSGSELMNALGSNFENLNGEKIRAICKAAPKFGNDDDYVDELVRRILDIHTEDMTSYKTPYAGHFAANVVPVTGNLGFGRAIGATPDGRKAGEPTSDSLSPAPGGDKEGPTAVIKSVGKIDHTRFCQGTVLNLKVNLKEKELEQFAGLIKGFMSLGGHEVQINIVTSEELKEAQRHPEKYEDLIVRVAGYSAYFVELNKRTQDHVIERAEHAL